MNSVKNYAQVTGALLALLLVTVGAAYIHLGPLNTAVAMLISITKGSLIVLYFMHLRHALPLVRIFAGVGLFWLLILLTLAMSDYLSRS